MSKSQILNVLMFGVPLYIYLSSAGAGTASHIYGEHAAMERTLD